MDVRNNATASDRCLYEGVKLLIAPNGEKEMSGGDAFHFQIFASVPSEL